MSETKPRATEAFGEYSALSASDRAAIAKHLSKSERRLLDALRRKRRAPAQSAVASSQPDWSGYSPALSKHLLRVIADAEIGKSKLTVAAQAALHQCLSQPRLGNRP